MILEPEDAKTMRNIGINVLSLIGVTIFLVFAATIIGLFPRVNSRFDSFRGLSPVSGFGDCFRV